MSDIIPSLLPTAYNQNYLQLMVVNPTTLYAYWEIAERTIAAVTRHYNTSWIHMPKIIRIYENDADLSSLPQDGAKYSDFQVHDASSWYFHELTPSRSYTADFGTLNIYGQFIPLIRSNRMTTPRNSVPAAPTHDATNQAFTVQPWITPSTSSTTTEHTSPYPQFSTYTVYKYKEGVLA